MDASNGVVASMGASTNGFLRAGHMRPRPIPASALGHRPLDGSYPFRSHRTVAEISAAGL